jgi:hypothetical protein
MKARGDRFEWNGGDTALDLVNTLDERPSQAPIERLATYRDLAEFAELAGLIDRRTAGRLLRLGGRLQIVKRARKHREHLHDVLAAAKFRTAGAAARPERPVYRHSGGTCGPGIGGIAVAWNG